MSAQLRARAAPALESMQHDHEANGGMTDLLEETVARATVLAGDILTRLDVILDGLELDEQRMRANLSLSEGLIGSESAKTGRASCRERGCQYGEITGGAACINKKTPKT